ncbi:MAG: flagellar basal body P-ring protein FlgI [Myxococcota bacterium]|nr:flagellar basal body P-ring protein FlgI [Myxococcales bacterium]
MALSALTRARRGRAGFAAAFTSLSVLLVALVVAGAAQAVRLKDLASVQGVRANQVIGYGLVVGLKGTGDKNGAAFTTRSLASMLTKMGIAVGPDAIQVKNVAAVMVTASLPPFARAGTTIDATVSSVGDASSIEGGTLLVTPLYGTDGAVYALAQGSVSVGGFAAGGDGGSSVQKNHPTVGRLLSGATVERELGYAIQDKSSFDFALDAPDFTTARRAADAINRQLGAELARAVDAGTLRVAVPEASKGDVVAFVARVERVEVEPDRIARVVVNERTGTVVMGADVRIAKVAVSHGNLSVSIAVSNEVSQPAPFSEGDTTPVTNTDVSTTEEPGHLVVVQGGVTIEELVQGLNAVGVTARDLIVILQSIKAAGALSATLEIL